jgi:hypothetical protein
MHGGPWLWPYRHLRLRLRQRRRTGGFRPARRLFHGFSLLSQDAKLEDDPSSNHAMTVGLQFSAMPLPLSSFIASSFLGRCDNPMPRKTFGALVNWTLS